jgi:transposase
VSRILPRHSEVIQIDERVAIAEPISAIADPTPKSKSIHPGRSRRDGAKETPSGRGQIHGFGAYTVLRMVAECGDDMRKWPTSKHFTWWLSLAPGNKISGGRLLSSKTRRSANRAAALLRIAAVNVGRTHTALGAFYRRLAARTGKRGCDRDRA